jgi:indolepyruvate ferredoxin oxidoreductase alpha subunit
MPTTIEKKKTATREVLLGDEAVAHGALHAGITAAYAYPGTPATEIHECLLQHAARHGKPRVAWCANEKTAYEAALGVSMSGRRVLVDMKHVGLNVAADPFINSAIVAIHGGLVVAVADDPGMHSSQNEQDSRFYADFARTICLEPADQQEAYEMTREAFTLSERFHVPVVVRLVTRLAHSRAVLETRAAEKERPASKVEDPRSWTLLPGNARRQWDDLLGRQEEMQAWAADSQYNTLDLNPEFTEVGIITTGVARNYYLENVGDMPAQPSHLHIGAYPMPMEMIRTLAAQVKRIVVLEEGYPLVERLLRGVLPIPLEVHGKESGHVPLSGELTPEIARRAMGLPVRDHLESAAMALPGRPPQLCPGCPHQDSYGAMAIALEGMDSAMVTSDIGCYTLGALPPYRAIESTVCMGASVGMARGAAEAGFHPAVGVIGDSTFLHSGVTPLMDAVSCQADMTLIIMDNDTVGMTGGQPTILPSSRLEKLILGLGVEREHCHVVHAHPRKVSEMAAVMRTEFQYHGLSVIICSRPCIETARKMKKQKDAKQVKDAR